MLGLLTPDHPFYPSSNGESRCAYLNYYNATFLYGLDFVSIGLTTRPSSSDYQELIADPRPRSYRKVILQNGTIVGALLLGERQQALAFKRAIDHRVNLAQVASQLFAADFNLDAWLDQQRIADAMLNIRKENIESRLTADGGRLTARVNPTIYEGYAQGYTRNYVAKDVDAFLVPVPHPKVHVSTAAMQLTNDGQADVCTIGRQSGVSLLLEHSSVSRLHAEITCGNGEYLLCDKGSSNGTYINGSQATRDTAYRLQHNDRVRFGDVQFRFELRPQALSTSYLGVSTPPNTSFLHIQGTELHSSISRIIPESILRTLNDTPTLVLVGQNTAPEVVLLKVGGHYTLGRDKQNDIVLADTSSSRQHAEIFSAPDGFYVRDLNSRYGVFVNEVKINNAYHLTHADRVVLGNMLVYFSYPRGFAMNQAARGTVGTVGMVSTMQQTPPSGIVRDERVITNGANRGSTVAPQREKEPVVVGLEHRRAVQRLGEERINFEIDMCIGCNRCMDAGPVPISSLVTIADLNSATTSERVAHHVARFTHECIMCGSCVPVCPVDNHRDLLMLSLKERLGVSWNSKPDMNSVAEALPTGWTIAMLITRLRDQAILCDAQLVPDTYLLHIIAASKQRILTSGETVIREGEYGRDLYLILEGRLELMAIDIGSSELPIAILRRGEYAGEDGMLTGHPYKASARAQRPTLLLQVPEQVMQRLMELVPSVRNHFEGFNLARSLMSILKRLALFQGVADGDIQSLITQTPVRQCERNELLFAEDNRGRPSRETLHILLEGFVKVTRHTKAGTGQRNSDERIIAYRQGGDYFAGGLDLLGDGQAVTVTTINRCRVAEVPRQVLLALFQKYPEVDRRFSTRLREYIETTVSTQGYALSTGALRHFTPTASPADLEVQAGLHSLVSDGVVEGTEVLVIDLDKCIHCDECEEACERRHGHSRMNRKGMVIGNISIATACRQCQDPVCMLCSRAGIARYPNGEVYITESCIGCGICAERCPYGAISIVEIEDESVERSSWQRFGEFFTKGAGKERARKTLPVVSVAAAGGNYAAPGPFDITQPRTGYDELRKKVAIKCDLCAGYSDQACVQACPTGAALRIQPTKFFGSTEEILRRRAN
jgi:Fe-S-cluster-containing hydrogenase component 2/pSer/pThr/pTyr-binding forkhead associated (FHA) protein/CRP-like cAMP-binding protein